MTAASTSSLVIAVEGLCYAGKTTLVHHLAPLIGAVVAPDYADLAPLPPWPPADHAAVAAALDHFLNLEQGRARTIRAAAAPVVLLDRSPVTLIAHECGMDALGVPAAPAGAVQLFADAADNGAILTPHAYIYLAVPEATASARRARRGRVAAHLDEPVVRTRIDHACRGWLDLLPPRRRLLLEATTAPMALARCAAAFVAQVDGSPAPSWRALVATEPQWTA